MHHARFSAALATALVLLSPSALAAEGEVDTVAEARAAFREGTALVETASWAEALAAFERAAKLRPHAVTTYNIAACEKALGRYTRAKRAFERALAESDAGPVPQLPESLALEARGYVAQLGGLLAYATVTVRPPTAAIVVDGRPLAVDPSPRGDLPLLVAGVRRPGPGEPPPRGTFALEIDPGAHVFTFARKGYSDAVVNKQFDAGRAYTLELELDELPATLRVASALRGAQVFVDGAALGPAPLEVVRPAGDYRIAVKKDGFVPYETHVSLKAGEQTTLRATLPEERRPVTRRWWFWSAAAVVVAGAAVSTYLLTRPTPERPEVGGGSLGWAVPVP
jgi:tetratricopeptide (TPR) repeat protein